MDVKKKANKRESKFLLNKTEEKKPFKQFVVFLEFYFRLMGFNHKKILALGKTDITAEQI